MELLVSPTEDLELMLDKRLFDFKKTLAMFERILQAGNEISESLYNDLSRQTMAIVHIFHHHLGKNSDLEEGEKIGIIEKIKAMWMPYILQTQTTSRFFTKPLGYSGDYIVIENIYQNREKGFTPIGEIVDKMHLESQTSIAVRNRRTLITNELYKTHQKNGPLSIACLASGPAREIYDLYKRVDNPSLIKTTLIDFDGEALAFCQQWIDENNWQNYISTLQVPIMNLIVGRTTVALEPQDVIYSIGIIDYLQDKHVVKFLNYIHTVLKPNGKVILGNFHKCNLFKEYMNDILEWKLIHRDEADMNRLLLQSEFGREGRIFFEPSGVNMFLECVKIDTLLYVS